MSNTVFTIRTNTVDLDYKKDGINSPMTLKMNIELKHDNFNQKFAFELKTNRRNVSCHPYKVIYRCKIQLTSLYNMDHMIYRYGPYNMPRIIRLVYLCKLPFQFGMD